MTTIGSLCSGACDGLSLGLEWAGFGPLLWQVEIDEDRRRNLARHWPDARRDVTDVTKAGKNNLAPVDVVVCSAPCKDLSSAGKRAGLAGAQSGLWYECERIVGELRPDWVVVENVASGAGNWVPHIRQGLERFGYATLPIPIAAADCGAPQRRARVFVVANADSGQQPPVSEHAEVASASGDVGDADCQQLRQQPGWSGGPCGGGRHSTQSLARMQGGRLSSRWCHRFMGYPDNWCEPPPPKKPSGSETRLSRSRPRSSDG